MRMYRIDRIDETYYQQFHFAHDVVTKRIGKRRVFHRSVII